MSEAWGPPQFQEKRSRSEKAILGALGEFQGILRAALGIRNSINSVQTRCIVKGEAQKSPLFWRFSEFFYFLRIACSLGFPQETFKFNKIPIFTNTPCKSTCLYNAPSMHTVDESILGKKNSILGMASHDLSNTKTTILGAAPGAILGIDGNPHESFSFAPAFSKRFFKNWGAPRAPEDAVFCLQLEASCLQLRLFAYDCVWELLLTS